MGADDEKMKFSVMPSTWFRNLKKYAKQNTTTNTNTKNNTTSNTITNNAPLATQTQNSSAKLMNQPRKSYHITRDLAQASPVKNTKTETPPVELPRKSLRRRSTKKNRPLPNRPNLPKKLASPSSSSVSACRSNSPDFTEHDRTSSSELDSILNEYGSTPDTFDDSCKCRLTKNNQFHPELAPIITKNRNHAINVDRTTTVNFVQEDSSPPTRRISTSSTPAGFKLRTNSPRIVNRRINQAAGRKSELSRRGVYESFAVVKTSKNPKKDFRESMVEMIVENNIMGSSKDLEDLLACYLSLNSQEYHDTIINVFKQIWFDYLHVTLK